jgi:septal ring factor EnvC (AmiA/AmiB activator)
MPARRAVLQSNSLRGDILSGLIGFTLCTVITTTHAWGQKDAGIPNAANLQAVELNLNREQTTKEEATRQAEKAAADATQLQTNMISAARRIQSRERTLTDLETQLENLETRRAEMASTLANKDKQMRGVLLALERLAIRPTDSLMLQPLKPSDAVRSGLVLSAAIPAITDHATQLKIELEALYATRTAIVDRRASLAVETLYWVQDQTRLEILYKEKSGVQKGFERRASIAEKRIATLAKEAKGLRELLDGVIAERKLQEGEEAKKAALQKSILARPGGAAPTPDIISTRRPRPQKMSRSFSKARGTLPFPAEGLLSQRYGENTESEGLAKGIIITTRPSARVVSPFDGEVAFAGPFRGYGQLLILEHSEGYHTLLAGMNRLDGIIGQRVLAGEPVGIMSQDGDTSLYVELRRDGQPINPLPWLATRTNENSG